MPLVKFAENTFSVVAVRGGDGQVAQVTAPGMVRNSGAGPAFCVAIIARMSDQKYGKIWAKFGPLGAGEEVAAPQPLTTDFDYAKAATGLRIEIEYTDLFKQRYQTVYMHDPNMIYVRGPEPPLGGKGSDALFPPET
jgi:hypothetical protein